MNKIDQLKRLEQEGFKVTEHVIAKGRDLSDDFLTQTLTDCKAVSPFALDGIVIDVACEKVRERLQAKRKGSSLNPAGAKKFKIGGEDNVAVSKVVKVHWKTSKNGRLKPRVEIEPVDLVGVTITFATSHNAKRLVEMGIGTGAEIKVTRAGDVIPFIVETVTRVEPELPDPAVFGTYSWDDSETDLVLDDVANNKDAKFQQLVSDWTGTLSIENVSTSGLEKLFEAGYEDVASIIKADPDDIYNVVGSRNAYKAMEHLKKVLNPIKTEKLAAASSSYGRGMGERRLRKVMAAEGTLLGLSKATVEGIDGFSSITAQQVLDGEDGFKAFMADINGYFTLDASNEPEVNADGEHAGMVVVPTGVRFKGETLDKIQQLGITVGGSVNGKTTHVVAKDPTKRTGKLGKAEKVGAAIMGLEEFETLIGA